MEPSPSENLQRFEQEDEAECSAGSILERAKEINVYACGEKALSFDQDRLWHRVHEYRKQPWNLALAKTCMP